MLSETICIDWTDSEIILLNRMHNATSMLIKPTHISWN